MGLFAAIVKTVINVATLPMDIVKDVVTLGGAATGKDETYTQAKLEKIKEEAEEED